MFDSHFSPGIPSVTTPPDGVPPTPPVHTRAQCLPFGELTWENFERLCHRLMSLGGDVEHCGRYGQQGEAQEGIDIFSRLFNGRYHCLQAKRHRRFGSAQIRNAVDLFLAGGWASRAESFTIAVQSSLRSATVQKEIEKQAKRLLKQGIAFAALDGEDLTGKLRDHPFLVDDFFGRPWVHAVLGDQAVAELRSRLDGAAFAKVRSQLIRVYETQFHSVDPGSFGSIGENEGRTELTLLERFQKPDILVREAVGSQERMDVRTSSSPSSEHSLSSPTTPERTTKDASSAISRMRRLPLDEWFGEAQRLVVLGDAGSGKSTLLRVITLDLLRDQVFFPELASRWGGHLPVYVPFARWSAQTVQTGGIVGIKDIVRRSLDPLLTGALADLIDQAIDDGRVLLLIDGLDEWGNEQAARTTLHALVTTVETHDIPAIVSGRPRGLEKIGSLSTAWRRGTVAPLSVDQQIGIASRWFSRFSSEPAAGGGESVASMRTSRFMAELARDATLAVLATTPLLLIGLVTLALRGQILPRTRNDIYNQLVHVLLELHPSSRATAAGDTESRFRYASDPAQLRAAIAHLAYDIREQAGGGAISHTAARESLRKFLISPSGFALDNNEANRAANEILSVNSETQGIIVEKGPGEVGFVHASFEEYLGAEHIGGWSFEDITSFVRTHAGETRWRNVITNLMGYVQRRNEVDSLVAVIEEPCVDELVQLNRQALLGDIAFGLSAQAAATAKRLALATMHRVESEDWLPARREALGSVLRGVSDPALRNEITKHMDRWLPERLDWSASLIEALGSWQPTSELQDTLFQAMHSEDPDVQRAAAKAYARVFSPSESACQRLIKRLADSRDLQASAALLESLAHGWSSVPSAIALFQLAWDSHRGAMRLAGAFGLCVSGTRTIEMRNELLQAQNFWSSLSHSHRTLAAEILATYWPDDPELIEGAITQVSQHADSIWESDNAFLYLFACDLSTVESRYWLVQELSKDYPFTSIAIEDRAWSTIGRLAARYSDIRIAANKFWADPEHRIIGLYRLPAYVAHAADPEIAAVLRDIVANDKHDFNRHWAIDSLIVGWGREHHEVQSTLESIIASPDEEIEELVSLLPAIYGDKKAARQRLIRMGLRPNVRRDLLVEGLARCGCDASDSEAIQSILSQFGRPDNISSLPRLLFTSFGKHPSVRSIAANSLYKQSHALSAIATGYANDPEFGQALLNAAIPLPAELRTQIIELAEAGASGTALEVILSQAMQETNPELRVRMVVASYARLPLENRGAAIEELLAHAVAVGPYFDGMRSAALAGLTALGALDGLVELKEAGKPLKLYSGGSFQTSPSLARLICERFSDFESIFGEELPSRFHSWGDDTGLAEILSVAPSASPAARAAFRALAEGNQLPLTVAATNALASERPRSALLLQHCFNVLEDKNKNNASAVVNGQIAVLLRTHFPEDAEVERKLVALYKQSPSTYTAISLAIYSPQSLEFSSPSVKNLGHKFGEWAIAVHMAASKANSQEFVTLLEALVTRDFRSQFDGQELVNLAVQERLQHDVELQRLISDRIRPDVDLSISGSFARYLAAAGKLDTSSRLKVSELLHTVAVDQQLPLAGYDAIADDRRAIRATLLDALSVGL